MRIGIVWSALAVALSLPAAPVHAAYGSAELLFEFRDERIVESSGIVSSARSDEVFFTHNDSGDSARFFAVGRDGETLATVRVQGATAVDWEDIAKGPGSDGEPALFLADVGNNLRTRATLTVYEVPEPDVDAAWRGAQITTTPTASYRLAYEDGPHDAEALMVDPNTRALVVVTKEPTGLSGVYEASSVVAGAPLLLRRIATVNLLAPALARAPQAVSDWLATAGDIAPDGGRVAIRTYTNALEWRIGVEGLAKAFAGEPLRIELPVTRQGEAIGYTRDGASLIVTSEGRNAPAYILPGLPE